MRLALLMKRCPWLLLLLIAVNTSSTTADSTVAGLMIWAIPSTDGQLVGIWAGSDDEIMAPAAGLLCDSISGHCRAMTCSSGGCYGTLTGLPAETDIEGYLSITLTFPLALTLESGPLPFLRAFVPISQLNNVVSPDNLLDLILFPASLSTDTYLFIINPPSLPAAPPLAHQAVGRPYAIWASGALTSSNKSMTLRLGYDGIWLDQATAHNLSIFAWAPTAQSWEEKGGTLFLDQNYLAVPIHRFTTYVLMELPAWRDTFADTSALSSSNQITTTAEGGLILDSNSFSGTAISVPITPTSSLVNWDRVVLSHTTSSTMSITVDVLSLDGTVLLTDVTSGESLKSLDPLTHPGLKLQGNLFSPVPGTSPLLEEWRVTWSNRQPLLMYLPLILKRTWRE